MPQPDPAAVAAPELAQVGAVGAHAVLTTDGKALTIRGLPVAVNADGANGLTRASAARAHSIGLYVPPGADSVPMAAYHPEDWGRRSEWHPAGRGGRGLDAPENGGRRIFGADDEITYRAWGFLIDEHGEPYVQMPGSAAPGYLLSQTSLADPRYVETDPRHWFDSAGLPGWTLPAHDLDRLGVRMGDLARVSYQGVSIWAQAFDSGHSGQLLELSVVACFALGIPDCARSGGVPGGVDIEIIPGSGERLHWLPGTAEQISKAGTDIAAGMESGH